LSGSSSFFSPFTVALKLEHAPHWHTYYLNPGLVGDPPAVEWSLPEGFTASELEFPVPTIGVFAGENFYGYNGEAWFLATITPPDVLPETAHIKGEATWLACKEQCIPGDTELSLTLPSAAAAKPAEHLAAAFDEARARIPLHTSPWKITATDAGDTIVIDLVPGEGCVKNLEDVHLFSSDRQDDANKPQKLAALPDGGGWRLVVPRATEDALGDKIPRLPHISGILSAGSGWLDGKSSPGLLLDELPLAASDDAGAATGGKPPERPLPLLMIFAFMFLGGLILNLMPCVFPVIGLKIMSFVQRAGEDRRQIMIHGLLFAGGVLVSFWILCAVLLVLRQTVDISWGFQLQNPWIVLTLLLMMFLLAMNMFGVFEIGLSATSVGGSLQSAHGALGSFFSGVLATVVATPCSAPFLGAGIGAAIGLPTLSFLASFTFMALGLALPYLVLSAFPKLLEGLTELPFMLNSVIGLSFVAVAVWIHGRWNVPARKQRTRIVAGAFIALFGIGGVWAMLPPDLDSDKTLHWEKWSAEKVEKLLAEGTPVYVDFTANWCMTCQVNKKRAYTEEVVALMKKRGIVALKADNTKRKPEIDRAILDLGRGAVPVNVLYVPGKKPIVTPELLSPSYLLDLFKKEVPEK